MTFYKINQSILPGCNVYNKVIQNWYYKANIKKHIILKSKQFEEKNICTYYRFCKKYKFVTVKE